MKHATRSTSYALTLALPLIALIGLARIEAGAQQASYKNADFDVTSASVSHLVDLDLLVFEQHMSGTAGGTTPTARGQLDGAPVLGYVFPTSLKSTDVGFSQTDGIVALAVTSHPDFDDTPLWDENGDGNYGNDGVRWHTHWVILTKDARVPGGLSVKEFKKADAVVLPPTNPGMPMFMDSPGYAVSRRGHVLRVIVPADRIKNTTQFSYDAVTCYMQVSAPKGGHAPGDEKPMLGVYEVFKVLSGNLALPYRVTRK